MEDKLICYCCGDKKNITNFYISKSFSYQAVGKLPICKNCLGKIYDKYFIKYNDIKLSLYYMCRATNLCFDLSCYNAVIQEIENSKNKSPWRVYMTKLNSLGGKNGAGDDFDSSDILENNNNESQIKNKDIKIDEDFINFWGEGYSESDYRYLDKEFEKMVTRYECDSYAQETLFQDIAFQRLDIRKKRQNAQSVDKELKTLQDLLGSANIKPAQENASMASEQVTFGTLIKKYENEKPIPEPLESWTTADWIKKYVCVFFFGNLCKMMGKPNPFQQEYEKEMKKYTVEVDDE
ncbi:MULTISPECIES: hypothetical protein [unclassified Clostridium]|uniref:hypothetical protein n=1 Tax=unclassified Clostridium TaxID=2614128 RepID=UPI00207AF532|nr:MULTISPECIES: hypothetical protein [unclassified Clostridium]